MAAEPDFYERAYRRIQRAMWILLTVGSLPVFLWKGWSGAAGFLFGGAVSVLGFRSMKQMVQGLGAGAATPRKRLIFFIGFRYLLFGAAGYVIVNFFGIDLSGILVGLFVTAIAVFFEVVYELIYART